MVPSLSLLAVAGPKAGRSDALRSPGIGVDVEWRNERCSNVRCAQRAFQRMSIIVPGMNGTSAGVASERP
jgi:hypothetical protein